MAVTLMVGTEKGLFSLRSDERRETWTLGEPAHKGWSVYSLYEDRRPSPPAVYAGLSNAFFGPHLQVSEDGGETWRAIEDGPRFPEGSPRRLKQVWSLSAGPEDGFLRAGVAEAALFESRDGGETWQLNEALESHPTRPEWMPGAGGLCLHTIVQDPGRPERAFIGISAVGIFRTDDGGASWAIKNKGVGAVQLEEERKYTEVMRCVHKFVQSPSDPNVLYQQNHTGVYRSRDAGDNWERIENGLPSNFGFPMVVLPRKPETLFVIPQESDQARMFPAGKPAVYRSTDGGDSWVRTHAGLEEPSYSGVLRNSMTTDRQDDAGVYFGTTGGEVYASFDEGESWHRLPGHFPRIESLLAISR